MQPRELCQTDFSNYPLQGRAFAIKYLLVLRQTPLALLPILLREIVNYDWCFPVEQHALIRQFDYLESLPNAAFTSLMAPFAAIRLPNEIEKIDWVNQAQYFSEQLSALLWSMQQIDAYHQAALQYQEQMDKMLPDKPPAIPRFTIVTVGKGVLRNDTPLFRSLRLHGTLFTAVQPDYGIEKLMKFVNGRAQKTSEPYAHWYIDGGQADPTCSNRQDVTTISYNELAPVASKELNMTENFIEQKSRTTTIGPEAVQSFMASLRPADVGMNGITTDPVLRHFQLRLLTEGAGTQVFSTTFVQWAAREAMRRAQPITMFARFSPRQRMAPMNELLKRSPLTQQTDPEGSLVDADMGAYYTWINQNRLAGADQARFLAWFEGHGLAVATAPNLPRGTTSNMQVDLGKILEWMN